MALHNINDIYVNRHTGKPLNRIKKVQEFVSFDTETEEGLTVMLTDSKGNYVVSDNVMEYLEFLHTKRNRFTWNFFYNLDYDVKGILKFLSLVAQHNMAIMHQTVIKPYRIQYLPKKKLTIDKWNEEKQRFDNPVYFYDVAQHFKGLKLLEAAIIFKTTHKTEIESIKTITYKQLMEDKAYHKTILDYCINDSKVCNELVIKYFTAMRAFFPVSDFLSGASVSRDMFRHGLKDQIGMPKSKRLYQHALNAYHAGYNETLKLGLIKKPFTYDLNSAYPATMRNMLNPKGIVCTLPEYLPDATYSMFKVKVSLDPDTMLSPLFIPYKSKNYHPYGENIEIWINKDEYELLENISTDLKILEASHIISKRSYGNDDDYIFRAFIDMLYKARLEAIKDGNHILAHGLKILMNSLYGSFINVNKGYKFATTKTPDILKADVEYIDENGIQCVLEKVKRGGSIFCPPVAMNITAGTRKLLFDKMKGHEKKIVKIATDGFVTTKKIHSIKPGTGLGEYSLELGEGDLLSFGGSRFLSRDKDNFIDDQISRMRGITQKASLLNDLFEKYPDHYVFNVKETHVVTLKDSLYIKKYRNRLNEFIDGYKSILIGVPTRLYSDYLFSYREIKNDIIESVPLDITEIKTHDKKYDMARQKVLMDAISNTRSINAGIESAPIPL